MSTISLLLLGFVSRDRSRLVDNRSRLVGNRSRVVAIALLGLRGVDRGALVAHLSHEALGVVSRVGGGLDPTVGQGDGEGALDYSIGVLGLCLLEVGLGVVVRDAVLVGEGLGRQLLLVVDLRVGVGGGIHGGGGRGAIHGGLVTTGNSHKAGSSHKLENGSYYYYYFYNFNVVILINKTYVYSTASPSLQIHNFL